MSKVVIKNYPEKFTVHRKIGAFQLSPIMPTWQEDRTTKDGVIYSNWKVIRAGSLMIEMAPFKEEREGNLYYDWSKKVSFALGIPDIASLLDKSGEANKLTHSVNDGDSKVLQITPGTGDYAGTLNVSLAHFQNKAVVNQARVAFNTAEWLAFTSLIEAMLPMLLGWNGRVGQSQDE